MLFELKTKSSTIAQAGLVAAVLGVTTFGALVGALGVMQVLVSVGACMVAVGVWWATAPANGVAMLEDGGVVVRTTHPGWKLTSRIDYEDIEAIAPPRGNGGVEITYKPDGRRRTAVVWPERPEEFAGEVEWRRAVERRAA